MSANCSIRMLGIVTSLLLLCGCQELQYLREANTLKDQQIKKLTSQLQEKDVAVYKASREADAEIETFRKKSETTEKQLKETKDQADAHERQLQQEILQLKQALDLANNQLTAAQTAAKTTEASLAAKTTEADTINATLAQTKTGLDEQTKTNQTLAQQIETLKTEATTAKTEIETLKASIADKEKQLAEKDKQIAEAKVKSDEISKKLAAKGLETTGSAQANAPDASSDTQLQDAKAVFQGSLKKLSEQNSAQVNLEARGVVIQLAADYLFKEGIDIDSQVTITLDRIAEISNRFPQKYIEVIGHTDNQAITNLPFTDNWSLGSARADKVVRYFVDNPDPKLRIDPKRLKASSCAQFRPSTGMARRVDIILSNHP